MPNRKSKSSGNATIQIPNELAYAVDNFIDEHPELGLRSRTDAIIYILRTRVHRENPPVSSK